MLSLLSRKIMTVGLAGLLASSSASFAQDDTATEDEEVDDTFLDVVDDSDYMPEDPDGLTSDYTLTDRTGRFGIELEWNGIYLSGPEGEDYGTGLAMGGGLIYVLAKDKSLRLRYVGTTHNAASKSNSSRIERYKTEIALRLHADPAYYGPVFAEAAFGQIKAVLVTEGDDPVDAKGTSPVVGLTLGVDGDFADEFSGVLAVRYSTGKRKGLDEEYAPARTILESTTSLIVGMNFYLP